MGLWKSKDFSALPCSKQHMTNKIHFSQEPHQCGMFQSISVNTALVFSFHFPFKGKQAIDLKKL